MTTHRVTAKTKDGNPIDCQREGPPERIFADMHAVGYTQVRIDGDPWPPPPAATQLDPNPAAGVIATGNQPSTAPGSWWVSFGLCFLFLAVLGTWLDPRPFGSGVVAWCSMSLGMIIYGCTRMILYYLPDSGVRGG